MLSLRIKVHSNVVCPLLTSANYRFYGGTFSKERVVPMNLNYLLMRCVIPKCHFENVPHTV